MNSQRSREGYLMVDHRASPGLPEDVARQAGYDPAHCGEGKLFEAASLTCSHCKISVIKNPMRLRERAKCDKCGWHYICDWCDAERNNPDYSHLPFEALLEVEQNFAQNKGVEAFLGTPQELLRLAQSGKVPILKPREPDAVATLLATATDPVK
jgi:hypothetical protein